MSSPEGRRTGPVSVRALLTAVLRSLRRRLPQLAGFEIVVKVIAWAIVIPLSTWLSAQLISTTGSLAVANEEIVRFLLRPAGILTITVVLITDLAARMSLLAGPMLIDASARTGVKMSILGALARVGRLLPQLIRLGLLMVGRFLLVAGPLAAIIAFAAFRLLSERDIYYYLTIRPTEFWIAAAVAGALGAVMVIVGVLMLARWIFSVPVLLFEGLGGSAALARSRELSKGSFWRLAAMLVVWALVLALLASLAAFIADQLGDLAASALGESLRLLVPALGLILGVYLAVLFALDVAGPLSLALTVFHLYVDRVGGEQPQAIQRAVIAEHVESAEHQAARIPRWARWAAVLAIVALAVGVTVTLAERVDLTDQVEITAHRGSSLRAPENTLAAIELAIAEGADYAEIDVQETADGVVVVIHDRELKRVTGVKRDIWDVSYAELSELDAGSWFSEEFADQRIPSLQETIDTARGRIKLNIELKFNSREEALAARTVELIRRNGVGDEVILTSLDYQGLSEAGRLDPSLKLGFIVARSVGNPWGLDVDFLSVETRLVDAATSRRAHNAGKQVHVWSVNDPLEMSRLIDLGVDNIITDDPVVAREVLRSRAELSDVERLVLYIRSRLAS